MHLILMTRGIQESRDRWKKFMESQMFLWKRQPLLKDAEGKYIPDGIDENGQPKYKRGPEEVTKVQGALRPIELWEYVFPFEGVKIQDGKMVSSNNFHEVLAMQNAHNCFPLRPEVNNFSWVLRKMMGAEKIPKIPDEVKNAHQQDITTKFIPMSGMAVYPIGIKRDVTQDFIFPGGEAFYQEGL